jgi:hypothetical protein
LPLCHLYGSLVHYGRLGASYVQGFRQTSESMEPSPYGLMSPRIEEAYCPESFLRLKATAPKNNPYWRDRTPIRDVA